MGSLRKPNGAGSAAGKRASPQDDTIARNAISYTIPDMISDGFGMSRQAMAARVRRPVAAQAAFAATLDHQAEGEPTLTYRSRHESFDLRPAVACGRASLTSLIHTRRARLELYIRLRCSLPITSLSP